MDKPAGTRCSVLRGHPNQPPKQPSMAAPEDLVVLQREGEDTSATVHLYGSTLISWKCRNEEKIFVSSKSLFDNKKAIRGGIPIVFPQFGAWEHGPQHGFARISRWTLEQSPTKTADGDVEAKFSLSDNEHTRSQWNYKFKLVYTVVLKATSLVTELSIQNTGSDSLTFTCLLHTYLQVPYISHVTVSGLQGCTYVDKVNDGKKDKEENEVLRFSGNVDRVYINTGSTHEIIDSHGKAIIKLTKTNFPETVVWNPWEEKARAMADMGNEDYVSMVCVEPGLVDKPMTLPPGVTYSASQTLSV